MEEMTVVSFFVNREGVAWDKEWRYEKWERLFCKGEYALRYIQVGLPFWKEKDTMWQGGEQAKYLQALPVPEQGRRVCYMRDRETSILYGLIPDNLSVEWGLFLLRYYQATFDAVVIFEDRENQAQELARRFAPGCLYVGVVTNERWRWEETEEYILEEYGYQIEIACSFASLHPKGKRLMIWSGSEIRGLTPLTIPEESIWLDTTVGARESMFRRMRNKKINRLNIEGFLQDFLHKSCIYLEKGLY